MCVKFFERLIIMSSFFDFDKYRKHNPRDYADLTDDEFDYEYADEFAFPDFDDEDDEFDD